MFRGGKKHTNHGNTVNEMLVHMARKIRKAYREEVPIIVRMYAGFFDDEVFKTCEQLPFKRFNANAAWYYLMVLGNNLFEAFKEDVTESVIPVSAYADTFRRRFIDTAGKLVRHAGKLVMKVNKVNYVCLKFVQLYEKCRVELPHME